jgi:hypothetical protein
MTDRPFAPSADVGPFSGFVGAVLGSALYGSIAVALALVLSEGPDDAISFGALVVAVAFFILALVASLFVVPFVALFVGLPFSWILAQLRCENAITYTVGGAVLGLLPLVAGASGEWEAIIKASFGVYGGTCGWLWWRLDRSSRQPVAGS